MGHCFGHVLTNLKILSICDVGAVREPPLHCNCAYGRCFHQHGENKTPYAQQTRNVRRFPPLFDPIRRYPDWTSTLIALVRACSVFGSSRFNMPLRNVALTLSAAISHGSE